MKFFLFFLFFIFLGCAFNQTTMQKQKIILESGVEIIIKNSDVLPLKVQYQSKAYLIIKDENGKLIVKKIGVENKKPPFNNY